MARQIVELDLKALYEKYGSQLEDCYIVHVPKGTQGNSEDYYELYNDDGEFLCMDGEFCEVISRGFFSDSATLISNEPHEQEFFLTGREFKCATQRNLKEPRCDDDDNDIWLSAI